MNYGPRDFERYGGGRTDSGVRGYVLEPRAIHVLFQGNEVYVYDQTNPGRADVQQMMRKAVAGAGLSTYISQNIRQRYARKYLL